MRATVKTYATFDEAASRVGKLRRQGMWPGIVGPDADGNYRLTFDPWDAEQPGG